MHLRIRKLIQYKKILLIFLLLPFSVFINGQTGDDWDRESQTERITNFHSDIAIDSTGRVLVKESITVYAGGINIRRGIFREIPLYRTDVHGKKQKMKFNVLSVLKNSDEEPFFTENEDGNLKIYIGNKDYILPPAIYEYTIVYETFGQVGFFDTYDELYWNVTGNFWNFTIEKASATIYLPEGGKVIQAACYTGAQGSTDKDGTIVNDSINISFMANKPLRANEGFTVAVSFPRDIVKRPPPPTKAELFWLKYREYICSAIALLIMGIYYIVTWFKVGRDPRKEIVIPTFKPPHNWSAAGIRYLYKLKYDSKTLTAAIVSLAVKKALVIKYISKVYTLEKKTTDVPLSNDELEVYNALFSDRDEIMVKDNEHEIFFKANDRLENSLAVKWNLKDYFLKNWGYAIVGLMLTLGLLFLYAYLIFNAEIFLSLITFCFIMIGVTFVAFAGKQKGFSKILILIVGLIISVSSLTSIAAIDVNLITKIFLAVLFVGYAVYFYLIKAPTPLGAKTKAEIEGFKMYLETAEEHRLNMLTPPEHTPELFEKMLPYAIALDVENKWGEKFDSLLKQLNYSPDWYYGGTTPFLYGSFANSLSNSFTSSVSRAQVDPTPPSSSSGSGGWSSGSGGGGFSGGGGGGGGGGGW